METWKWNKWVKRVYEEGRVGEVTPGANSVYAGNEVCCSSARTRTGMEDVPATETPHVVRWVTFAEVKLTVRIKEPLGDKLVRVRVLLRVASDSPRDAAVR